MYLSNLYIHHQQIQYDQNYQNIAKVDERTNSHTKSFVIMRRQFFFGKQKVDTSNI